MRTLKRLSDTHGEEFVGRDRSIQYAWVHSPDYLTIETRLYETLEIVGVVVKIIIVRISDATFFAFGRESPQQLFINRSRPDGGSAPAVRSVEKKCTGNKFDVHLHGIV